MNRYFCYILVLFSLWLSSCSAPKRDGNRRVVTVTIEPLRYFAERIAGDRFDVRTMVPAGGNPETYEPSAQQMVDLSRSDLYVKVGNIGFERTWMQRLAANAPRTLIIDSSEGIVPACSADGTEDPHTWMSAANAQIIAGNICKALIRIDGRDSLYFVRNLETLRRDIRQVDAQIRKTLAGSHTRAFLIYHPILTYFARDYGLTQIPMEQEGKEPSASQLQAVITEARRLGVSTFFVQQEFANRNVDVVSRGVPARREQIDPLGYQWDREMKKVASLIK